MRPGNVGGRCLRRGPLNAAPGAVVVRERTAREPLSVASFANDRVTPAAPPEVSVTQCPHQPTATSVRPLPAFRPAVPPPLFSGCGKEAQWPLDAFFFRMCKRDSAAAPSGPSCPVASQQRNTEGGRPRRAGATPQATLFFSSRRRGPLPLASETTEEEEGYGYTPSATTVRRSRLPSLIALRELRGRETEQRGRGGGTAAPLTGPRDGSGSTANRPLLANPLPNRSVPSPAATKAANGPADPLPSRGPAAGQGHARGVSAVPPPPHPHPEALGAETESESESIAVDVLSCEDSWSVSLTEEQLANARGSGRTEGPAPPSFHGGAGGDGDALFSRRLGTHNGGGALASGGRPLPFTSARSASSPLPPRGGASPSSALASSLCAASPPPGVARSAVHREGALASRVRSAYHRFAGIAVPSYAPSPTPSPSDVSLSL